MMSFLKNSCRIYNPCAGKRERDAPNADYVAMPRNFGYYEFDDWAFFRDENHDLRFWWMGSAPISASSAVMSTPTFKFTGCCIPTNGT
ncbi:hypothetical protein L596_025774 [Steinernema carpocapsae]|uniref:Uncharacterized protein n=1 Tax=Steinernema carpocapsae TaxID=34508 RepID=A0A4U5M8S2_STECR|nr:hypothetical protein L596_025774 [Steinernema carpocapsae]